MKTRKFFKVLIILCLVLSLAGCGRKGADDDNGTGSSVWDEHFNGSMELKYADQFRVDFYQDGYAVVSVEDGLRYLITKPGAGVHEWMKRLF